MSNMRIPRVINQTAPNWASLPGPILENIREMRKMNPDWEYRFYSDDDVRDFIERNYEPEILEVYESINPKYGAARADLFRYLLIYKNGGLYLDIKSQITKPLDLVIGKSDSFIYSEWDQNVFRNWGKHSGNLLPEIQNWFILSEPGSSLLAGVIDSVVEGVKNYRPLVNGVGRYGTLRLTGPIRYSLSLRSNSQFTDATYRSNQELGFNYSLYKHRFEHRSNFLSHYSRLTEPIVKTGKVRFYLITKIFLCLYFAKFLSTHTALRKKRLNFRSLH
jgi:hypothetical protein